MHVIDSLPLDEVSIETDKTKEFRCSSCGAGIAYKPGSLSMKCPYCDSENEIPKELLEIEEHTIEEFPLAAAEHDFGMGVEQKTYKCDSCGAKQSVDAKVITTKCDFCGSDTVIETPSNPNIVRPTALVPFAINAQDSKAKYLQWLRKLWFRPGDLKKKAALVGVRGLYAPFFTFDAQAESNWSGWRGTYYYTTETYTTTVNGRPVTRTRQVQHVRWNYRSGHHSFFYDDLLVNASMGLPEEILHKIYPYQLSALVGYQPEFIVGFGAEEYTKEPWMLWDTAKMMIRNRERDACSALLDGDTQRGLNVSTSIIDPKWKHILLPVYVSSYMYRGKRYNFLVNGQTGEVQGEAPLSWLKIFGLALGIVGIVAVLIFLGFHFNWF